MRTAILVDGGFYRRRAQKAFGDITAQERASELANYCKRHLDSHGEHNDLYRIFYYDCPPTAKRIYHPFLKKQVDLSKSDLYIWMHQFLNELKNQYHRLSRWFGFRPIRARFRRWSLKTH